MEAAGTAGALPGDKTREKRWSFSSRASPTGSSSSNVAGGSAASWGSSPASGSLGLSGVGLLALSALIAAGPGK